MPARGKCVMTRDKIIQYSILKKKTKIYVDKHHGQITEYIISMLRLIGPLDQNHLLQLL